MSLIRNCCRAALPSAARGRGAVWGRPAARSGVRLCCRSATVRDWELWGDTAEKYQLHRETVVYGGRLRELGVGSYGDLPVELLRGQTLRVSEVLGGRARFSGTEKNFVHSYDYRGKRAVLQAAVYAPSDVMFMPNILVYFHGGGLVTGSRHTHATMLKTLASMARCVVVSVEYRLAPEHKFPASFYDAFFFMDQVLLNRVTFGGHIESRVGVGGDGSGGLLAANVIHDLMGINFQILLYPMVNVDMTAASFQEFDKIPGLNTEALNWQVSQWSRFEDGSKEHVLLAPSGRSGIARPPPTLLVLAQLDPLRDQGLEHYDQLVERRVKTELVMVQGAPHGFLSLPSHFAELTAENYEKIASFIRQF